MMKQVSDMMQARVSLFYTNITGKGNLLSNKL